ncbi:MAG: hypothetical protein QOI25_3258, partial [Mycobacterium sp.]|nr:hypothetical protein [Mycobacterium sp.]
KDKDTATKSGLNVKDGGKSEPTTKAPSTAKTGNDAGGAEPSTPSAAASAGGASSDGSGSDGGGSGSSS